MMQEPKPGKRIVSKGAYAAAEGERVGTGIFGCGMLVLAAFFAWITVSGVVGLAMTIVAFLTRPDGLVVVEGLTFLTVFLAGAVATYVLWKGGIARMERSEKMDSGIPLTRANVADLPAPETLVRASSEPPQAQEAILLRAALEGQETPPEQLVRPSVGTEQP